MRFTVRNSGLLFMLLAGALALAYQAITTVAFHTVASEKYVYSVFLLVYFFGSVVLALAASRNNARPIVVAFIFLLLNLLYLIFPMTRGASSYYVARDFAIGMLWVGYLLLPKGILPPISGRLVKSVVIPLLLIAVIAPLFSNKVGRFEQPSIILFPLVGYLAAQAGGLARAFWLAVFVLLMCLAFGSGQRTVMLLALALPFLLVRPGAFRVATAVLLTCLLALGLTLFSSATKDVIQGTRFEKLAEKGGDSSLKNRYFEVKDAFRSASVNRCQITGCGHGALFVSTDVRSSANILDSARHAHHIHVTPFALYFRYGVLGAFIYLAALWKACGVALSSRMDSVVDIIGVTFMFWVISGVLFDVTVQPLFWLTLACMKLVESRSIDEIGNTYV